MATEQSRTDSIDTTTAAMPVSVPEHEIRMDVERPYRIDERDEYDGVAQINAVLEHPPSGRSLKHMFVWDETNEVMLELEIGYLDDTEVYRRERTGAEYRSGGRVYVEPLDEVMSFALYADTVGFDEPAYRLGVEWDEHADLSGVDDTDA